MCPAYRLVGRVGEQDCLVHTQLGFIRHAEQFRESCCLCLESGDWHLLSQLLVEGSSEATTQSLSLNEASPLACTTFRD